MIKETLHKQRLFFCWEQKHTVKTSYYDVYKPNTFSTVEHAILSKELFL
jgi:hypothetical protein